MPTTSPIIGPGAPGAMAGTGGGARIGREPGGPEETAPTAGPGGGPFRDAVDARVSAGPPGGRSGPPCPRADSATGFGRAPAGGMTAPAWIGADWGTTNLRVWAMSAAGEVLAERGSAQGMGSLAPGGAAFEPALMALIGDLLPPGAATPVVICGMAGALQGWAAAPYAPVPGRPDAAAPVRPVARDPRIAVLILGGLCQSSPADVMRGEETQIAGFLAGEPGFVGTLCLPGTHTKWVQIAGGLVTRFQTCMTGEMFALLAGQSILRHSLGDGWDEAAYLAAIAEAAEAPETVATRLFAIRAAGLLGGSAPATATARLSGLLIGLELAATRAYWSGAPVVLIGAPALADRYAAALDRLGTPTRRCDAGEMTRRGLSAAWDRWRIDQ